MKSVLFIFTIIFLWAFTLNAQNNRQLAQPVLMALPTGVNGDDALTSYTKYPEIQAAATAINQILVERKLEVRDLKQQVANFDRLRSKMSNLQGDPNALIAANSGADIYLEFTTEIINEGPGVKARVDINVKEAATAKLIGASSGQSDAIVTSDISSLCQIAVNNCIDRIMEQIRGYWVDIPTTGKPIILTISAKNVELNKLTYNDKKFDREMTNFLKTITISYRREISTSTTMQFNPVYIDAFKYDDVESFSYAIQDFLDTFGLKYSAEIEGKSIEISIN
jgi:hypothetical protein